MNGALRAVGRLTRRGTHGARHHQRFTTRLVVLRAETPDEGPRGGPYERIADLVQRELGIGLQSHQPSSLHRPPNTRRGLEEGKVLGTRLTIHAVDARARATQ